MALTEHDDLREHKALVTGATSGIGRAIAVQFGRMGAEVLVHGRATTRGGQVVEEIERVGGRARFVAADLSDPADLQRLLEDVGDVDLLVNSAGFSWFGPSADLDVDTFDALFAIDVRAHRLDADGRCGACRTTQCTLRDEISHALLPIRSAPTDGG